jgi:hypothetical protein
MNSQQSQPEYRSTDNLGEASQTLPENFQPGSATAGPVGRDGRLMRFKKTG